MAISEVPAWVAWSDEARLLSNTAFRLLIYIGYQGSQNGPHARGGYVFGPVSEYAQALAVPVEEVRIARHQLIKYGFIERRDGVIDDEHHYVYHVCLVEPASLTKKEAATA